MHQEARVNVASPNGTAGVRGLDCTLYSTLSLFDMAYSIGLYPRPSATEIEQWLAAKGGGDRSDCEEGVAGWAFVCDVAYHTSV